MITYNPKSDNFNKFLGKFYKLFNDTTPLYFLVIDRKMNNGGDILENNNFIKVCEISDLFMFMKYNNHRIEVSKLENDYFEVALFKNKQVFSSSKFIIKQITEVEYTSKVLLDSLINPIELGLYNKNHIKSYYGVTLKSFLEEIVPSNIKEEVKNINSLNNRELFISINKLLGGTYFISR